ncbi:hypothetical protein Y1Q_0016012 [Alligator mississippiensis]|uniref:Uncharacterized protein n=1 Tax=Alligator mississippiensis TaxID=8496 RepID=A0A151MV83_ALLMI|nr:hypothetical protein Y1Q_0016012 [Alligator mississippiensis]
MVKEGGRQNFHLQEGETEKEGGEISVIEVVLEDKGDGMEGKMGTANSFDMELGMGKKEDTLQTTEVVMEQEKEPERQVGKIKKAQGLKTRKKKPDNESKEKPEKSFLPLIGSSSKQRPEGRK